MQEIKLEIESKKYHFEMMIKHRINIVNSLSGTGKTYIGKVYNECLRKSPGYKFKIDNKEINARDLTSTIQYINETNQDFLIKYLKDWEGKLVILDEVNFKDWTQKDVNDYNRVYNANEKFSKGESPYLFAIQRSEAIFIIISRTESMHLPVDMEAVYEFVANGKEHRVMKKYPLKNLTTVDKVKIYDKIITEDSKPGYYLMQMA